MAGKAKLTGAAGMGAMALALGLWIFSEGDGPRKGDVFSSYQDIVGVWTICHGHTGREVKRGMTATKAECEALAESDLGKGFAAEDKYVNNVTALPIWTRAGVAVFAGNVGVEQFRTSSVRRLLNHHDIPTSVEYRRHHRALLNTPDIPAACNAILLFNKARAGPMGTLVVVTGLINRRERERHLCLGEPW